MTTEEIKSILAMKSKLFLPSGQIDRSFITRQDEQGRYAINRGEIAIIVDDEIDHLRYNSEIDRNHLKNASAEIKRLREMGVGDAEVFEERNRLKSQLEAAHTDLFATQKYLTNRSEELIKVCGEREHLRSQLEARAFGPPTEKKPDGKLLPYSELLRERDKLAAEVIRLRSPRGPRVELEVDES